MSHHHSFSKTNPQASEYFWGCTLTKDSPTVNWSFTDEDDDTDFMDHTLFLRNATLGPSAVNNERNIVQVETTNYEKNEIKQPLISLTCGLKDSSFLDISFGGETPVVFRLIEGSGPVHLSGQQLVEFPPEEDVTQDETEIMEDNEDLDDSASKNEKSIKRKAQSQTNAKSKKKGKLEVSAESEDDDEEDEPEEMEAEEEEEDYEEDDDDDDDEDYGPTKGKKTSKPVKGIKTIKKGVKKPEKVASKVVKKITKKVKK